MHRNILIFVESRFPVTRKKIRKLVNELLDKERIKSALEIGISFVGDRKMRKLNREFRNIDKPTTVLSFTIEDLYHMKKELKGFVYPPDDILRLGDIIISYPQVILRATEDEMMVEDKIKELIAHGLNSLLGRNNN